MKSLARTWAFSIAAGCIFLPMAVAAQPSEPLCRTKFDAIDTQLKEATDRGQRYRVRGLQRALAQVSRHCTDAELTADFAKKLRKQEREVAERQRDLEEAQAGRGPAKIARRQSKLHEAQEKLDRLKAAGPS